MLSEPTANAISPVVVFGSIIPPWTTPDLPLPRVT